MRRITALFGILSASLVGFANADVIGHYGFESDASDASGYGNHGTIDGNVTFPGAGSGVDGNGAGSFNIGGGGGQVEIPLEANPNTHAHLTVGMWARPDASISGTPGLYKVFGHDDGGWDRGFGLDHRTQVPPHSATDYRWAAFTGGAGPGPTSSTGTAVTDNYTFVAATWDAMAGTVTFHADGNTVTQTYNPTISTLPNASIGSLRPDSFAENFVGLIDEVFVIDHPMTAAEVQNIRTAGPSSIGGLVTSSNPARALEFEYNFDSDTALSGAISGWTNLGGGTAFDDQPANNVTRHPALGPHSGSNYIGTFEDAGEAGSDGPTGTLESQAWILSPNTRIEFAVSGGFLPFTGTPAAPGANVAAFNVEREVGPNSWEVIASSTGFSANPPHEGFREGVFDLRDYAGDNVRMRIYDTATGGWGHINVDTIQVFSIPEASTSLLALVGLATLALRRRRRG